MGCGHTEPFGSADTGPDQPFDQGPPARLTLNQGPDRGAAWLPDGSGILYSAQQLGRRDRDVCLALIPPGGGRQRQLTCDLSAPNGDLTDALESAAASADGRLAFVAGTSSIGATNPNQAAIVLASVDNPTSHRILRSIPYSLPAERIHTGVTQLQWLGPNRILFLGEQVSYQRDCVGCPIDTLRTGLDAIWLAVDEPTPIPRAIPGTEYASGISTGSTDNEVYYTLGGDSRVFRQTLSDGVVSVVYDFGPAGIARDVQVRGNRMVAVVGGRVTYGTDAAGPIQWDSGGIVHVVDLPTGTESALEGPGLFRRPQISPSGTSLVVEVYPLVISGNPPDALVSRRGDLYLYGLP